MQGAKTIIYAQVQLTHTVRSLAEDFHSGALTTELLRDGTDEEVSKALIAVRGIGQVRRLSTSLPLIISKRVHHYAPT